MILETLFIGGAGFFLYRDSRSNFIKTRTFVEKISGGRIKLTEEGKNQKRIKKAKDDVNESAKQVARLRESVASTEADMKINLQKAMEQRHFVDQFDQVLRESIEKGDEKNQIAAASAKVRASQKVEMLERLAQAQQGILPRLREQLDDAELELSLREDQANNIEAMSNFAEALSGLYMLNSNIDSNVGFTPKAHLTQAVHDSQREVYKAESLLGMANKANGNGIRKLLVSAEVSKEIESARQRISLPAAEQSEPEVVNE